MKNCNRIYTDRNCNIIIEDEFDNNYVNIYVVQHTAANGKVTSTLLLKEKESDKIVCNFKMDGNYSICKIDVPLDLSSYYYYNNGKFYKNVEEVDIKEVISVNPEVSGLNFEYDNYFCKCSLQRCYIKICLEILDKRASFRCDVPTIDLALIYKRDLLNSAINVIDYMVEFGLYAEALRLLERITGCNGLCDEKLSVGKCGCMQM